MKLLKFYMLTMLIYGCNHTKENHSDNLISEEYKHVEISQQDTIAIKEIIAIQTKHGNFEEREKIWSEDGRWLQAFGRVFHGRDTIINFIKLLHNNPGFSQSTVDKYGDPEIKFLRPDVAVVHQYHEREGQVINEVVTPTRRINTTYIITKENGIWLLRDKVTMDERPRTKN